VFGGSYWTASLQYRALRGGARLAREIHRGLDVVEEYETRASLILDYMQVSLVPNRFTRDITTEHN
jgi:glucoamylase